MMMVLLLGGALVTKTESGAGCGRSWPLCHGKFVPTEIDTALVIELGHRLTSGLGMILVVILAILSWKHLGHIRETKMLAFNSVFFIMVQALLGAGAVIWGQRPIIMALHFGVSLLSYAAVFLLTLLIFEVDKKFDAKQLVIDKTMKFHIYGLSIYCYIVVYTGALVRHTKASLVCPDVPFCSNNRLMPATFEEWVQMGHRTAAILIVVWITIAMIHAVRYNRHQKILYYGWIIAFTLAVLQVLVGISIIFTNLNVSVAIGHAFLITCIFGLLSYFLMLALRAKQ